jgi:pyrimidine-nucleoside phosphorylase
VHIIGPFSVELEAMRAVDIIQKKRDGGSLGPDEIGFFVTGVATGSLPDYQAAALLMAIFLKGMEASEAAALTEAMVQSGSRLDLSDIEGAKVDKHSTGGVGDKSSLVIAPLVAACGGVVPMMSGRGLGHTGGTLDKLESIPGFRTDLSIPEIKVALSAVGCAMVGQSWEIAPADKKLYALRDVTGTIESIPLIASSIMSKKIAEGIDALVLDVKAGSGAFMKNRAEARRLAESLVAIGHASGVKTHAIISAMDWPIGFAVGNANEVIESIEALKGNSRPDLLENSLELSERMLVASRVAKTRAEARTLCSNALASGAALEKFRAIVEQQGGDPRVIDDYGRLPHAPSEHIVKATARGFVSVLDAGLIGRASVLLGAGRDKVDDTVDRSVGVMMEATVGDAVEKGDAVLRVLYRDRSRLDAALQLLTRAIEIGPAPPTPRPLIIDEVA